MSLVNLECDWSEGRFDVKVELVVPHRVHCLLLLGCPMKLLVALQFSNKLLQVCFCFSLTTSYSNCAHLDNFDIWITCASPIHGNQLLSIEDGHLDPEVGKLAQLLLQRLDDLMVKPVWELTLG